MKKTLLSIGYVIALSFGVVAQSTPRTVLLEHFTQASCGPCASANPAIKTYLSTTTVDIVHINYQTSWPGVDPMNAHNPTEVASRVTLYGVTGVPNSVIDGNHFNGGPIGTNFGGVPGWTDATFTTRKAVMSSFIVDVSAKLNNALDSVHVTLKVKASDAVSGTFTANIAVLEKEINFTTAPGSNGEKDFYNVVKKMLPNQNGTALISTAWLANDSVIITKSWKLSNVYDKSRLSVAAWVSKGSTKEVMQSGNADVLLPAGIIAADVAATQNHTNPTNYCTSAFIPKMKVKNNSATLAVDTFQVSYTLNGGTPSSTNVYTSIAPGGTYLHTFTGITLPNGETTIDYAVNTTADNTSDLSSSNDITETQTLFIASSSATVTSIEEGFENGSIENAFHDNPKNIDAFITGETSGFEESGRSFVWVNFNNSTGSVSSIIWDKLDFTTGYKQLIFSHAYAQYGTSNDKLEIFVSVNCGQTWTSLFNKAGSALKTAPKTEDFFIPTAAQWVKDTIDLSDYNGEAELMLKFKATSAYGNNLWVDDIMLDENLTYSVNDAFTTSLELYPNPSEGVINLSFNLNKTENVTIQVYNTLGAMVINNNLGQKAGNVLQTLDLSDFNSGIYFVNVIAGGNTISKKVTLK